MLCGIVVITSRFLKSHAALSTCVFCPKLRPGGLLMPTATSAYGLYVGSFWSSFSRAKDGLRMAVWCCLMGLGALGWLDHVCHIQGNRFEPKLCQTTVACCYILKTQYSPGGLTFNLQGQVRQKKTCKKLCEDHMGFPDEHKRQGSTLTN